MPNTLLGHSTTQDLGYRKSISGHILWFSLAVAHWPTSDERAYDGLIYSRDSAAAKLTPQQLAYSQKLVSEWRAK